eukprot:1139681-Pelagomonas_calceolata.AAC.4
MDELNAQVGKLFGTWGGMRTFLRTPKEPLVASPAQLLSCPPTGAMSLRVAVCKEGRIRLARVWTMQFRQMKQHP